MYKQMFSIVTQTIHKENLKEYKDYLNFLFRTEDGVYNICTTEEDIIKSNQWFKNFPLITYVISDNEVKEGDMFLAVATNRDLNGKIFTYLGANKDGIDLIDIMDEEGKKHISTIHLMTDWKRFERYATFEDKRKIVDGQTRIITLDK